ncbi:DinB superfamily protein [Planctomycetes bacterium Pla163]|uniref:DinB superfamily protein n=1 Tax=Rohdeia mirabilis TaxID=2528008 RepID=A0A518CZ15_9BACT|nr:DinB superfamily protein [Planctomycetes bacterium Pla163]
MCSHDPFRSTDVAVLEGPLGIPVWRRRGQPRELLDLEADCEWLAAFYDAAAGLRDVPTDELFAVHAGVSAWSAGQHLFHVCLANELALRNVRLIADGTSSFVVERPEVGLVGALVLPVGAMPRGLGTPPRAVTPPARSNPAIVWDTFDSNQSELRAVRDDLPRIARARGGVRHADLGVLGAGHWIRFAGIHGWHHLAIAEEILAAG